MHSWPNRSQYEHVGLSPGHFDFLRLSTVSTVENIACKSWARELTDMVRKPALRVLLVACLPFSDLRAVVYLTAGLEN